jgi:pyruvate/2-oxoglutarate dehydrogenase complex dihydrolipoamide dehydrogenase (E3) component
LTTEEFVSEPLTFRLPALISVAPVKNWTAVSVSLPVPFLVRVPVPDRTPPKGAVEVLIEDDRPVVQYPALKAAGRAPEGAGQDIGAAGIAVGSRQDECARPGLGQAEHACSPIIAIGDVAGEDAV